MHQWDGCRNAHHLRLRILLEVAPWILASFILKNVIEIDHITPRSQDGGEELSNKCALHRHCHDQRHARRVNGTHDKSQTIEEPDDANVSRPVLKPSGRGDPVA